MCLLSGTPTDEMVRTFGAFDNILKVFKPHHTFVDDHREFTMSVEIVDMNGRFKDDIAKGTRYAL